MKIFIGIILGLAVIGGLVLWGVRSNTPTVVVNNTTPNQTATVVQTQTAGAPLVVTSSSATPSDTTVIVSGTVNPNGAFTNYWYEFGQTPNLGSKTKSQTIGSGFVNITAPTYITGLAKNTIYYFRLVAENRYGAVSGSQYTFQTTSGTQAPTGNAPSSTTISATAVSRTAATLNGEVTPNQASTQYWFEYGKTVELGNTSAFSNVGDGANKTAVSISLSELEPATTYYFRLNAQNQFGTVNGSILNFKTIGPVAPASPSVKTTNATDINSSSATLHGTVNPNGANTNYWFEYSTDSLLGSVLLSNTAQVSVGSGVSTISVDEDISGLSSNTTYYFRLVAQNSQGTVRGEKQTFKTQ